MKSGGVADANLNILVIMLYWYPYEGPLMPIYGAIFQDLIEMGHEVTIVTSFPHYRKGREETWEVFRGKLWARSHWGKVEVIRSYVFAPVFRSEKLSLVIRALNFLSFNLSSLVSALFLAGKPSLIFAPSSPPLSNGIIAKLVGVCRGCPVVYNVQDLYPDMAVKMGMIKNGPVLQLLKCIEKIVYRASDRILTISKQMADTIQKKGVKQRKVHIIHNFMDAERIAPKAYDNRFSREFGLVGNFVVMYAGNIGIPHGVEVLVDAAELLKAEEDILFCFVARGEYKAKVQNLAKAKALSNCRFIEPQPEQMVPYIWSSASVGAITYRKDLSEFSVPSKLLAVMSAARPVIASLDHNSEAAGLIRMADCGMVVEPEDAQAIVRAVHFLKSAPDECHRKGKNGRRYILDNFQRATISGQYESLFRALVKK